MINKDKNIILNFCEDRVKLALLYIIKKNINCYNLCKEFQNRC